MNNIAIKVHNLGKQYRLQAISPHRALRQKLNQLIFSPFYFLKRKFQKKTLVKSQKANANMWALRAVSFEIKKGEVVGLIGHNGAGKSVLLKILSRITKPSTGYAEIRGKMASFLEVDTGFHRDLTGRENIYMSGAILGMSRFYIEENFSKIVELSELEKFLDTPVKRYSSGMRVKLAFAIAAQLRPEILILDEILSVADEKFKLKCLKHLKDMANSGQTILIVSHDMDLIQQLCNRVLVIENGQLTRDCSPTFLKTKAFSFSED